MRMEEGAMSKEEKDNRFIELVRALRSLPKGKFEGMSAPQIAHFIRTH